MTDEKLDKSTDWLMQADGILITAGAGMDADSGLSDFRGDRGFWREYAALEHLGFSFEAMANPERFEDPNALEPTVFATVEAMRRFFSFESFEVWVRGSLTPANYLALWGGNSESSAVRLLKSIYEVRPTERLVPLPWRSFR
jgi:hypothetical protein